MKMNQCIKSVLCFMLLTGFCEAQETREEKASPDDIHYFEWKVRDGVTVQTQTLRERTNFGFIISKPADASHLTFITVYEDLGKGKKGAIFVLYQDEEKNIDRDLTRSVNVLNSDFSRWKFEIRRYGRNGGKPSESTFVRSLQEIYDSSVSKGKKK